MTQFKCKASNLRSQKHKNEPSYFYVVIQLYSIRVLVNILSGLETITDSMKVFIVSEMVRVNPFATNLVQSNRHFESGF